MNFSLEAWAEYTQLERLRSEDTPRRLMITHTIDQFILLTSSYRIWKIEILEFCHKLNTRHTL